MAGDGHGRGVTVPAEALARHAKSVDDLASRVDQARSAGAGVTVGRDAYGQLCQFVPELVDPAQQAVVRTLRDAVDTLLDAADRLRDAGGGYHGTDGTSAGRTAAAYGGGGSR
jgi:hypothetical protein